jgi:hypothetical protein
MSAPLAGTTRDGDVCAYAIRPRDGKASRARDPAVRDGDASPHATAGRDGDASRACDRWPATATLLARAATRAPAPHPPFVATSLTTAARA